jgi:hypothetical protein
MKITFKVSSIGEYYQVIEELVCPFGEKKDFIILKGGEITYWQNVNNYYYRDMKLNIEMMKSHIIDAEITKWRSDERKQKNLKFLRETLAKMVAYEREIKINEVLDKTPKDILWLAC